MIVLNDRIAAPTAGGNVNAGYKIPAANGIAKTLYALAQIKFWIIFCFVSLPQARTLDTSHGLLFARMMSAVSFMTAVPIPLAIHILIFFYELIVPMGYVLIPSTSI